VGLPSLYEFYVGGGGTSRWDGEKGKEWLGEVVVSVFEFYRDLMGVTYLSKRVGVA